MVVSTYQAASGAGAAAMEELRQQTRDVLEGKPAQPKIFPYQVGAQAPPTEAPVATVHAPTPHAIVMPACRQPTPPLQMRLTSPARSRQIGRGAAKAPAALPGGRSMHFGASLAP